MPETVIWQVRKLLNVRGSRLSQEEECRSQVRERSRPALCCQLWVVSVKCEAISTLSWKNYRHTQKTKSPGMATFIQHRKLMGEIAGQRVNFDVALVTTSQNTSFWKWCWEDNTGWDQKRALKDQARANDVHSLETILFQHNILKYVSIQSPLKTLTCSCPPHKKKC